MKKKLSDVRWHATAGYLYTLSLPPVGLAWEYLRRNPRYRDDWAIRRTADAVGHPWGLHQPGRP